MKKNIFFIATTLVFSQLSFAQEGAKISVSSRVVEMDVMAYNGKNIVKGLQPQDFIVKEIEGRHKEQQIISSVDFGRDKVNVFFAVDTSKGLVTSDPQGKYSLTQATNALASVILGPEKNGQLAVYKFGEQKYLCLDLTSNIEEVDKQIETCDLNWEKTGSIFTAVIQSLDDILKDISKNYSTQQNIVILISDGEENNEMAGKNVGVKFDKMLKNWPHPPAKVYTVRVGSKPTRAGTGLLKKIASSFGGTYFEVKNNNFKALGNSFRSVMERYNSQYTITYYPRNPFFDGKWRDVEIKPNGKKFKVAAVRKGYIAN